MFQPKHGTSSELWQIIRINIALFTIPEKQTN
jgi:hypothetical protein